MTNPTPAPRAQAAWLARYELSVDECTRRGLTPVKVAERKAGGVWDIFERVGGRKQRIGIGYRDYATALSEAACYNENLVRMFS